MAKILGFLAVSLDFRALFLDFSHFFAFYFGIFGGLFLANSLQYIDLRHRGGFPCNSYFPCPPQYYQSRWLIEDLFRTINSGGLNYERSELESGPAQGKLFIMSFMRRCRYSNYGRRGKGRQNKKGLLYFPRNNEAVEEVFRKGLRHYI
jgi:hypothetical protein